MKRKMIALLAAVLLLSGCAAKETTSENERIPMRKKPMKTTAGMQSGL